MDHYDQVATMERTTDDPYHGDDICIWPNEDYCYGSELWEMTHKSDDFFRVQVGSPAWCYLVDAGL